MTRRTSRIATTFLQDRNRNVDCASSSCTERFQSFMRHAPFAIQIHSPEGVLLEVNKVWEKVWGVDPEQLVGSFNIMENDYARSQGIREVFQRALTGKSTLVKDRKYDPADFGYPGRRHWARSRIFPLVDDTQTVREVVIVHEDITVFKESEERFNIVVENANEAIIVVQNGRMKFFNKKALEIAGYSDESDYADKPFEIFVHPDYREVLLDRHVRRMHGELVPSFYQAQILHKDGHAVWLQLNVISTDWQGRPASLAFLFDITAQKEVEHALARSEALFKTLFHHAGDIIFIHDQDGRILEVNQVACESLAASHAELTGMNVGEIGFHGVHPPVSARGSDSSIRRTDSTGSVRNVFETVVVRKDGGVIPVEINATSIEFGGRPATINVCRDITARKRMEEEQKLLQNQLLHSQKMESIGRLAGGVAHDFNNILTVILGFTKFVMADTPQGPLHEDLMEIINAGNRAGALTRQLLAFSRRQVMEMESTDFRQVVDGMAKMLNRMLGEDIELSFRHSENIGNIMADICQVEQVLMNLAVNARDAMPEGGQLIIEVYSASADGIISAKGEEGTHVLLRVGDTGCGIPEEIRDSVFEPFFTTKEAGKGTGLGLATVYGIVSQHQGEISIHDLPEGGTRFDILFPVCPETDEDETDEVAVELSQGSETILVVEDDPAILRVVKRILDQLGYVVLAAHGGDEALAISAAHEGDIQVLLTDVIMPGINGKTLAGLIREERPDVKTIFISGYTDDVFEKHGILGTDAPLVQKPLTQERLASVLRAVLDIGKERQV